VQTWMSRITGWTTTVIAWLCVLVAIGSCVAWVRMYREDEDAMTEHGRGIASVKWGNGGRSLELTLDGAGVTFIQNQLHRDYDDGGRKKLSWGHLDYPLPQLCTLGADSFAAAAQHQWHGIYWMHGKWVSNDTPPVTRPYLHVVAPHWLLISACMPLPAWRGTRWYRRRRTFAKGLCRRCGYDLRATPERCPECGTPALHSPGEAEV
jgi:hypothetical protein